MDYIRRLFVELFNFLVVEVVNYLSLFFLFILGLTLVFPAGLTTLSTVPLARSIVLWWSVLAVVSIAWYTLSEAVYCGKLLGFISKLSDKVESAVKAIESSPGEKATITAAGVLANDHRTIDYFNRIVSTATYEALYLVNWNLGYLAIPLLALFGANPMAAFGVVSWPILMLPAWCLIGLGVRYLSVFYLSRVATNVAELYTKVVLFYKNATSGSPSTN